MRLLRCLGGEEFGFTNNFTEDKTPPYGILSHTWGDDEEEITYQDILQGGGKDKKGYTKLKYCVRQAEKDGFEYFWVDTCCINKDSSAELSEAINSMYCWYVSQVPEFWHLLWAYLSDITCDPSDLTENDFKGCKWFKRGWTLQELIAPSQVHFFNETWEKIGTKHALSEVIRDITGIDEEVLYRYERDKWSVAQRMSWAAARITTRSEDRAYCLLGIFDINMPLLYGEGDKAFLRLQEEIIKHDDDHSIFAWQMASDVDAIGLLAPSPSCFLDAASIVSRPSRRAQKGFKMTNRGLSIFFQLTPFAAGTYLALLKCLRKGPFERRQGFAITLRHLDDDPFEKVKLTHTGEDESCVDVEAIDQLGSNTASGTISRRLRDDDQLEKVNITRIGADGLYEFVGVVDRPDSSSAAYHPIKTRRVFVRNKSGVARLFSRPWYHSPVLQVLNHVPPGTMIIGEDYPGHSTPFKWFRPWSLLVFDMEDKKLVQYVAVGLDFEFNPTCHLLEMSNFSDAELWASSKTSCDSFAFMEIQDRRAMLRNNHNGVYSLKGSRHNGLYAILGDLTVIMEPVRRALDPRDLDNWEFRIASTWAGSRALEMDAPNVGDTLL